MATSSTQILNAIDDLAREIEDTNLNIIRETLADRVLLRAAGADVREHIHVSIEVVRTARRLKTTAHDTLHA